MEQFKGTQTGRFSGTESNISNAELAVRPRKHHKIKCFLTQYARILGGSQFAINRYLDPVRDFQVGDTLTLCEGYPDLSVKGGFHFTSRELSAEISCIDEVGCLQGFGTLSLRNIGMLVVEAKEGEKE